MHDHSHEGAVGKLLLRLTVGGLMLLHGIAKLTNPDALAGIGGMLSGQGLPEWLAYAVLVGEILAPVMLIAGFQARLGGLLIAANMVVAVWLAHMSDLLSLTQHGGWAIELQAFYLLGGLSVALLGSGRLAVRPD